MGWLERCYQVYEKNLPHVGKPSASIRYGWDAPVLLPVAHTTQKVNVELILSEAGEFLTANVLCGKEMTTVIPCTEESLSRTSKACPIRWWTSCNTLQGITQNGAAAKSRCGRSTSPSCRPGAIRRSA